MTIVEQNQERTPKVNGRETLIPKEAVKQRVQELAKKIAEDYHGNEFVVVCVLKGAIVFTADLIRELDKNGANFTLDTIEARSYDGQETTGAVQITKGLTANISGRHVLVTEDIVDTGFTTSSLLNHLSGQNPASIRVCSLLSKPSRRQVQVNIDYLGFEVEDWVEGYGLDTDQKGRGHPDIEYYPETT